MITIAQTKFESNFLASATGNKIFVMKLRDTFVKPACRACKEYTPSAKNPFDVVIYSEPVLCALELKSGKGKSFSFDEKIIKEHQIKALAKNSEIEGVISGFVFNFTEVDNETYFLHINDFIKFKETTDRKSIPYDFIKEKGIEIKSSIKKVNYKYDLGGFLDRIKSLTSH